MQQNQGDDSGGLILIVVICLITLASLVFCANLFAEQKYTPCSIFFLIALVGTAAVIGDVQRKTWGKSYSVIFGLSLLCLLYPDSNIHPGTALLAFFVGIIIVIWALDSLPLKSSQSYHENRVAENKTPPEKADMPERSIDISQRHCESATELNKTSERETMMQGGADIMQGNEEHIAEGKKPPETTTEPPEESTSVDELNYKLEKERFLWQVKTQRTESGLLNRNFGVIITAIVSIAAVTVSYMQLTISLNNSKAQLENDSLKNDRQFYFEVAKFLLANRQELTTQDTARVIYLRNVVISSFPNNVAIQIATRMRDTAGTADLRKIWNDGLSYLQQASYPGNNPGNR
jgi:hypothetical protein